MAPRSPPIRERAARARTETWSRSEIEALLDMETIGEVQAVGGAHLVERPALLAFLDAMIGVPSVEESLKQRLLEAAAPPSPSCFE